MVKSTKAKTEAKAEKPKEPVKRGRGKPKGLPPPKSAFKKGQGGNPKGRPKADYTLRDLIRQDADKFHKLGMKWMGDEKLDIDFRYKVFNTMMDRGFGKVPLPIADDEGNGTGVTILINGVDADL